MTRDSRLATRDSLPWRRLVLSVLIVTLSTQPVFLLAAAFIQLEDDLGLSITGLGALSATFFLTAAIASAPLGRVVERIGWQRAMKINCVGSAAVLVAIALFARSVPGFVVLLVLGGAFYGFANPAANKALAEQVDAGRRGITFGLKHAGIPSSTLLAGLAIPALILTVGWEFSFAVAALLAGPVWVLIAVDRDPLRQSAGAPLPGRGARPLTVLDLVMLAAASALSAAAAISLGTFLIAAAVEEASFTQAAAGVLLFVGSLASIAARIAVGAITDYIGGRGFAGVAILLGTGALVFLLLRPATGLAFGLVVVAAFATAWGWTGLMTFTVVNANTSTVAASSAIMQAGIFLGAGLGPILLGWTIDQYSFSTSWVGVTVLLLMAASIVTIVGLRTQRPEPATTVR
jgi:predicted MFS family arabinose efflux permease